jgi:pyruvate formate lyase activating enzyme
MKTMINRRTFLQTLGLSALALKAQAQELARDAAAPKEALWYQPLDDGSGTVRCELCPRRCAIPLGATGFCRARMNVAGRLCSLGYNLPCSLAVDPVEKKPFFNFYPKTRTLSLACAGCNLRCKYCQTWELSQTSPLRATNTYTLPSQVPLMAKGQACRSVAFTYTEPTTFYEYLIDSARAARKAGLLAVCHSNGFINPEPLGALCKQLDAANIDLKGFSEKFYADVCEGELAPVLASLKRLKQSGVWLEITNLVIPGHNDNPDVIADMCGWIRQNLGAETPIHFCRFFPMYRMAAIPPTPVSSLETAREIAMKAGLAYAYIGNVPGHPGNSTYCPKCRKMVIKRAGHDLLATELRGGHCRFCNEKIAGVGLITGGTRI